MRGLRTLAAVLLLGACKSSSSASPAPTASSSGAEWLVNPTRLSISTAPASGEIDGASFHVSQIAFVSSGRPPAWEVRVTGTDAASRAIVLAVKLHEPVVAPHTYFGDKTSAAGTSLSITDPTTKLAKTESDLVSVFRVQIAKWDVKPWANVPHQNAGKASGRLHIGVRGTDGKEGGVAGTFTDATVVYLDAPPVGEARDAGVERRDAAP